MRPGLEDVIESVTGSRPDQLAPMGGGCVADVLLARLANGERVVVKTGDPGSGKLGGLDIEGFMLGYLKARSSLPVPDVLHAEGGLLIMTHIETGGGLTAGAQEHAAELLADLHGIAAQGFGFECDTLIGGLHQPNPWTGSWSDFFRDQRLLHMGRQALDAGRLPAPLMARLETLAGRLGEWIEDPAPQLRRSSLLHGDMWTGNVLCRQGRIAGFIDPALYYGDPEIELAFSTLFGTFSEPFFRRYQELRPIAPGFFEARRDLYNLYPLLVHVRLFGGSYVASVERTLGQLGC